MNKWLVAPFLVSLHSAGAQNKTLISNTDIYMFVISYTQFYHRQLFSLVFYQTNNMM